MRINVIRATSRMFTATQSQSQRYDRVKSYNRVISELMLWHFSDDRVMIVITREL